MAPFEDFRFSPSDFKGTARLFPLPNLVLFPHILQPLHVFEPRYRDLVEEALAGDRLVAMATLAPGWEEDYEHRPPLYPVACLARINTYHRLQEGSYNILVLGLGRVRLVRELERHKSFREGQFVWCEDFWPADQSTCQLDMHRQLREAMLQILPMLPQAHEQADQLLDSEVSLAALTDIVSYMLDIDPEEKEALLAELNIARRVELLLDHLSAVAKRQPPCELRSFTFPPDFSSN